jgi:hypothetical protein
MGVVEKVCTIWTLTNVLDAYIYHLDQRDRG